MKRTDGLHWLGLAAGLFVLGMEGSAEEGRETWRDAGWTFTLENESIEAVFQAGIPVQVCDRVTGDTLLSIDAVELPAGLNLFASAGVDLDACRIEQEITDSRARTVWQDPAGTEVLLEWSSEAVSGDLVLRSSAKTPTPVEDFRFIFFGCDISGQGLTWVNQLGVGHHVRGPQEGRLFIGDPQKDGSPGSQIHPLLALFQRGGAGWVLTGREEKIGPACMMIQGHGGTASIGFVRRFPLPTREPTLFEIRLRVYHGDWRKAVDPYVEWMVEGLGYVPLEEQSPAWIKDIRNQAYVRVGDFEGLERLARRLDPAQTFVGRMPGFRHHAMGTYGPDYRLTDRARKWFGRARELGFHVGAHFSTYHLSPHFPELMERFRSGFQIEGVDKDGNPMYKTLPRWSEGAPIRVYYVSHALEPWRKYFIEQLREAVEAGVDIIYLDEAAWPCGSPLVDGMTSVEGLIALEKEILETYPQVALQTEQFNPMASRHAAFALCQMAPGHPLGGYIFRRFVKVVPEGTNYQGTEKSDWDAVTSWGYMLPGADGEPSWLEVAEAFQTYELTPDIGLPRIHFETYISDKRHGLLPVWDDRGPAGDGKLFGYRGRDGITAYFEKSGNRRGLVVHAPDREPRWIGERVTEVTVWPGPGVLRQLVHGVSKEVDWFLYDGDTQLGLDPDTTYRLDRALSLPGDRFHVTGIPKDFAFWDPNPNWIRPQDVGRDGSFFKLLFTGTGEMTAYVPENVLLFVNGDEVPANEAENIARFSVSAPLDQPDMLVAFVKAENELAGRLAALPWQVPPLQRPHAGAQHRLTDVSPQGPMPRTHDVNSFYTAVTGMIVVSGKLPEADSIRLRGAYAMRKESESRTSKGDGVIRINGTEVVRVPAGEKPYAIRSFDADISGFAGRHVLMELVSDGILLDPASADWYEPQIVVEQEHGSGE